MATITEKVPVKEEQIGTLQGMLDWLRAEGNLLETDQEVDPDLEITGSESSEKKRVDSFTIQGFNRSNFY